MVYQSKWKPEDKIRIVMESVNTSASISELCRKYGVVPNTFYERKERFLAGGKLALSAGLKKNDPSRELENERNSNQLCLYLLRINFVMICTYDSAYIRAGELGG